MRVLMATDGSRNTLEALTAAARMLPQTGAEIELLCVAPAVRGHSSEQDRLCRRAKHTAEKTCDALKEIVSATVLVKSGSPARTIIGASYNYDLTVVGAASHRAAPMAGLGPVASRAAEHAHGAVLIARTARGPAGIRILAAVDGSDASIRALDKASQIIDLSDASVTLVHVKETPWLHAGPDQEWLGYQEEEEIAIDEPSQWAREFTREAEEILANAREHLPPRVAVETLVYEGLPADEILSEAERGDYHLIVIAASGSDDLKHRILGSVSSKIAWNASCSVLLVRPGSEE